MIIAQKNGRNTIGAPDKLFGVSAKAKERISQLGKDKVIDSTIGVLLDDDGQLVVLDSVMKSIRALNPEDYAAYAPILGLPQYREAVKKAVFLDDMPTDCFVESCYTPGGTGALRNAVSAYTKPGDQILVSSWHWNPYNLIAAELGRTVRTYTMFDEEGKLNVASFEEELTELLKNQDETVIILNTPAHNPTGYTMTDEDWDGVLSVIRKFKDKKIAVVVDIAYLDFSGDAVEYRAFLKKLTGLPENIWNIWDSRMTGCIRRGLSFCSPKLGYGFTGVPQPPICSGWKLPRKVSVEHSITGRSGFMPRKTAALGNCWRRSILYGSWQTRWSARSCVRRSSPIRCPPFRLRRPWSPLARPGSV